MHIAAPVLAQSAAARSVCVHCDTLFDRLLRWCVRATDANGDVLSITEEGTCIVDIYSVEVSTVIPEPVLDLDWSILSTFGDYGINSIETLEANGWTTDGINDYQICGLGGCTVGWCGSPCSGTQEYAGFWAGGPATGSISYALPAGFNRGVVTVGMSYDEADCHGTVTVGDLVLLDNHAGSDVLKLEFMYQEGDVVTLTEEGTCIVDIYELKVTNSEWQIESMFGRGGIASVEEATAAGWLIDRVDMSRATAQHSGFWCSTDCNGAMAYPLPAGSSRARLVVGMSYDNPDCHGVITVGALQQGATVLYDQYHIGEPTPTCQRVRLPACSAVASACAHARTVGRVCASVRSISTDRDATPRHCLYLVVVSFTQSIGRQSNSATARVTTSSSRSRTTALSIST